MFRSIRRTLLFWYAIIFIVLISALSGTIYERLRRTVYRGIDARLDTHAQVITSALEEMNDGSVDLELSRTGRKLFRAEDHPYYVVWDRDGRVLHRSSPPVEVERPDSALRRNRGKYREVAVAGPGGTRVLLGQKAKEIESVQEFLAALVFAGGVVMIVALAGGWFLAGRVLRPIDRISETAGSISAANLSRRIDVARTESELGRLAGTLNDMFARLEESFGRQARFTADASHELRTPLSVAMSHAELALKKERSPQEYREALEEILRASKQMKELVEGLLTLARADARQSPLKSDDVPFHTVVEEVAASLGALARERRVTLTAQPAPVAVRGDRERLREVVVNLITNAIRYMPEGGKVDVMMREENDAAVLDVADTGIGIPEKDRPHIFERFYRVDQARTRDQGGVGLGLAITKWIVEAHQGVITFVSREGAGTTFTVRLPKA